METFPPSIAARPRRIVPPMVRRGEARETTPVTTDALPYSVKLYGKTRRYQNGHDAIAFAKRHGGEVYFTAPRVEKLDYATQLLPMNDKAKPPKGSCGAFCSGQTTKQVSHHVVREMVTTRIY